MVTQLGRELHAMTMESLSKALTTAGPLGQISSADSHTMMPGEARGPLVGGCLSLINSSMGTPYELDTSGAVLFIEEVGEKVYVLDRMLTQLMNSGAISKAVGIIFGSLKLAEGEKHDVDAMLQDVLSDYPGPVVTNFPAGHSDEFVTLPLGASVELAAPADSPPRLTCTEGLLS